MVSSVWGVPGTSLAAHLNFLMGVKDVLQLTGIDVVAGGDDHALGAALEVDETLLVLGAQVAGIDPGEAVGVMTQGLGGLFRMLHVFLHNGGTGEQNLALLTVGEFTVGARLDDLDIGVREGDADAALLVAGRRREAAGRDGLGGAVAFADLDDGVVLIEELVELLC